MKAQEFQNETDGELTIPKPDFWDDMSHKQQQLYLAFRRNILSERISREHTEKINRLKKATL